MTPIDAAIVDGVPPPRQRTLQRGMELEGGWPLQKLFVECNELLGSHGRLARFDVLRLLVTHRRVLIRIGILRLREDMLEPIGDFAIHCLHLLFRHHALTHETRTPYLTWRRVHLDQIVQLRLRKARLIGLVVPVTAIADDVNEEILVESLAVRDRE